MTDRNRLDEIQSRIVPNHDGTALILSDDGEHALGDIVHLLAEVAGLRADLAARDATIAERTRELGEALDDFRAVADAAGAMHEPSSGPSHPGTRDEVVDVVTRAREHCECWFTARTEATVALTETKGDRDTWKARAEAAERDLAAEREAHEETQFQRDSAHATLNAEPDIRELQRDALPSNCTHCNGIGAEPPGCPESGACERCGGWTAHKRLVAAEASELRRRAEAAEKRVAEVEATLQREREIAMSVRTCLASVRPSKARDALSVLRDGGAIDLGRENVDVARALESALEEIASVDVPEPAGGDDADHT